MLGESREFPPRAKTSARASCRWAARRRLGMCYAASRVGSLRLNGSRSRLAAAGSLMAYSVKRRLIRLAFRAERNGLETVVGLWSTEGSNPSPSADSGDPVLSQTVDSSSRAANKSRSVRCPGNVRIPLRPALTRSDRVMRLNLRFSVPFRSSTSGRGRGHVPGARRSSCERRFGRRSPAARVLVVERTGWRSQK